MGKMNIKWKDRRRKTPTVLQMEAVECGAAALSMVMGYHGKVVPLEELRQECGVSRDGSKASNMLKAARKYGFTAKGYRKEPEALRELSLPMIVFWNFNHFVVLEGVKGKNAYINDPASGQKTISVEEFDQSFTGVVLTFEPGPDFFKSGRRSSMLWSLRSRMKGSGMVLAFIILAGLFLVIPGLIVPTFLKIFVDEILVNQMSDWFKPLLVGMLAVAIIKAVLTWLQEYYLLRFETKLALTSSAQFFLHVLRLPIDFFNQRFAGEISQRVQINDKVAQLLSGELATNTLNVVMILFYGILMFQYDVILTVIGVSIAALNVLVLRLVSRRRENLNQKLLQEQGKLMGTTLMGLHMIETLKASGTESDFFSQWSGYHAKVMNAQQEMGRSSLVLTAVPPLLTAINNISVLAIGGLRVMDGILSIGMLVAFQSLMSSFISPVNQMVNLGGKLQEMQGDMNRLDDVLKYPTDRRFHTVSRQKKVGNLEFSKINGFVQIQDLDFGYSRLDKPLISNFNLMLRPGDRVALVGGSGSGKSTIAKVLSGLYEPWNGTILFDGVPQERYPLAVLSNSIAMVDQDIFMFEGTIRENLTMWDQSIPDETIVKAAKDAFIHEDIATRPGGYDSKVEEGGNNFSGGQRQRLEIARALALNPTILIMDEATSALDPIIEKRIDERLRRRGCTSLIIAHRLSTIRDCDEIIVLDQGVVVQRGTHDGMAAVEGPYSELIKSS